jgi:hypothetical protein
MRPRSNFLAATLLGGSLAMATAAQASCTNGASPPTIAASVGYCLNTFNMSNTFNTGTVDMGMTYKQGFHLYPFNFFGERPTVANVRLNSDGSATVGQGPNTFNANLASAGVISASPGWVGSAFGGGAYISGTVKFAPQNVSSGGFPAFWATDLGGNLHTTQWPGQATGYAHFIETDIMEMYDGQFSGPLDRYQSTAIDWYGIPGENETNYATYVDPTVAESEFSSYNTYAMLWVPATATTDGYIKYYFNGTLEYTQNYTKLTNSDKPPPSVSTPWAFGIIDQDHLVIEMGSNNTTPITLDNIQVWQAQTTSNDVTVSPSDTLIDAPSTAQITDSRGGGWSINSSHYLVWNGAVQDTAYTYNKMFWNGTNFYVYCTTTGHVVWVDVNLTTGAGTIISGNPPGYP